MPHNTFYNLPEEKREHLLDVVWQEFTTYSYMDASINRIIQTAGISRGSFYQYFAGKKDLFSYLLSLILQTVQKMFQAQLTAHNNDLFQAVLGMYDLILWKNIKPRFGEDQFRIHSVIQLNAELDISQFTDNLDTDAIISALQELLLFSGCRLNTPQSCFALLHMLISIGLSNLSDTMRHPQNENRNRSLLETQLQIIRKGLQADDNSTV